MQPDIEDQLQRDLVRLFSMLHDRSVPYVLVGGVAMLTYVEGRNTKDVDLVLSVSSLEQLPEIVISDRTRNFARGMFGSLRVDVLLTTNPIFKTVQEQHAAVHHFMQTDVRCATVEGLMLLKFYALPSLYRQGDGERIGLYENDIFMLFEKYRPDVAALFSALTTHVSEDEMHELQNIWSDIQRRVDRLDRARQSKPQVE